MAREEIEALLRLTMVPYLGSIKIRLLVQQYGSAQAALTASVSSLMELPGFGQKLLASWQEELKSDRWQKELDLAERFNVRLIPYTSPDYPKRLLEIIDHPVLLYVKGTLTKEDQRCLAIVGTRQASLYGMEMARRLGKELAHAGFTIISGLARGIDTAAHEGALETGRTIGILGCGLAHMYPKENQRLASVMSGQSALISEFPMSTPPDRQQFPQRNRIVSGMAGGTLLIEAPKQSGAMITVDRALSQGRKVFALPGRADQENFQGNHALIKAGQAELIENSQDVLNHFSQLFAFSAPKMINQARPLLEPEEEEFIRQLPTEELSIEDLIVRTKWPANKLTVLLMSLVLKKVIKEYPGKIYKKI